MPWAGANCLRRPRNFAPRPERALSPCPGRRDCFHSVPPQISGVPYHRFKVGQTVAAPSGGPHALIPRGVHLILRLLPRYDGEAQYRILSKIDGHERVVLESQIVPIEEPPKASDPPPRGR